MDNQETWQFNITDVGETDLGRLDNNTQRKILGKLKWFTENFENIVPLPLHGKWKGFFKLRVENWRIVYEVERDTRIITVHVIDNRDKIYKRTPPK